MKSKLILMAFLFISLLNSISAQDTEDIAKTSEEGDFWNWRNSKFIHMIPTDQPTIEILTGQSSLSIHKDRFSEKLSNVLSGEIRLGYTERKIFSEKSINFKHESRYLFLGRSSVDYLSSEEVGDDLKSNSWRFGIGWQKGYGYNISKNVDFLLYNSDGLVWTRVEFQDNASSTQDQQKMDDFNETFRFGDFFEAGAKLKLFDPLSLNASYERHIVFPRHMFWYWALSEIIEEFAKGIADEFSKVVLRASPIAGPIVDFALKNGISYGIFELRKKNMNWPIESVPPLLYDTYRVGLSFTF